MTLNFALFFIVYMTVKLHNYPSLVSFENLRLPNFHISTYMHIFPFDLLSNFRFPALNFIFGTFVPQFMKYRPQSKQSLLIDLPYALKVCILDI